MSVAQFEFPSWQAAWDKFKRIRDAFAKADTLRILFVGETIIDEYRYVSRLGMTSKEFLVAALDEGKEEFEGGVRIAASQGEWAKVDVISPPAVIRKTRFVDKDSNRKLFEVYDKRDIDLHPVLRMKFEDDLKARIEKADVVIVVDYGHGLFGPTPRSMVEGAGHFLAVNAQSNAGNMGFNLVTKWSRADFVCIDEREARLAVAERDWFLGPIVDALSLKMGCRKYLITRGRNGSFGYDSECGWFEEMSAIAASAFDTIGAGDAVMAVTAPLVAVGLDMESVALVGNVVGALKVGIVGHRRHVGRKEIMEKLEEVIG